MVLAPLLRRLYRVLDGLFPAVDPARRRVGLTARNFDGDWYRAQNPDIEPYDGPLWAHFLNIGLYEKRPARFFDARWYFEHNRDLGHSRLDGWTHYSRFGRAEGRSARFIYIHSTVDRGVEPEYRDWLKLYDDADEAAVADMEAIADDIGLTAWFSILWVLGADDGEAAIRRSLESIGHQAYSQFEVLLALPENTTPAQRQLIDDFIRDDERLRICDVDSDASLAGTLNTLLDVALGDHVTIITPDDVLAPGALFWAALALHERPSSGLVYGDDDRIDVDTGFRNDPMFRPRFNYELLLSHNYLGRFVLYRRDLVAALGGVAEGPDWGRDLALRVFEREGAGAFLHIPRLLNHVSLTAPDAVADPETVRNHLARIGRAADVRDASEAGTFNHVRFALPTPPPRVSIIIPTRDRIELLRVCIESLLSKTTYADFEIIVVDNGSVEPESLAYFDALAGDGRIRIVTDGRPFNFSALNNGAVDISTGDYVCLMNNDIEIITPDWLEEMMAFAVQPGVGCVGARLWYPDDTLQHGGVLLGFHGVAGHMHKFLERNQPGYGGRAVVHQTVGAVTAAVLVVRKSIYEAVGGMDETLAVAFNDVDFCLKVQAAGYRNIYTPYAEMYHYESASRGTEDSPVKKARERSEIEIIKSRYGESLMDDDAYNPNLTLVREDMTLAFPPRVERVRDILESLRAGVRLP